MVFQHFQSAPQLRPFLKGYLLADSTNVTVQATYKLFPNGYSGVFFNYGELGKLNINEEYTTPRVSVFGQVDRSFDAIHWPGSYSIGVLFQPAILARYFRVDMSQFTNKTFDGTLIEPGLNLVHAQLGEAISPNQKIEILDRYFIQAFNSRKLEARFIDEALRSMEFQYSLPVRELAKQLAASDRYLEKQFKTHVGVSPKTYSMILRFKRIEQMLRTHPNPNWSELNFSDEYYDQNHFIKDFKRFTSLTPSLFLLNDFRMGRSFLVS